MPFDNTPTTPVSDVDSVLDRMRELLEAGWGQGASCIWQDGVHHFCMVGALNEAIGERSREITTWAGQSRLRDRAGARLGFDRESMVAWNDEAGRTKEEVLQRVRWARMAENVDAV